MTHSFLLQIEDGKGDDDMARTDFHRNAQSIADAVLEAAVKAVKVAGVPLAGGEITYLGGN